VPVPAGELSNLQPGNAGQFYFIRRWKEATLQRFDLEKRRPRRCCGLAEVPGIRRRRSCCIGPAILFIVPTTKEVSRARQDWTDAIEVKVNPRAEWNESSPSLAHNRDYFYDRGCTAWTGTPRAKYAAFLPDVTTRSDLNGVCSG